MARYGYMATIGADTSGLAAALTDLERHARSIQSELRNINFDINNNDGGTVALQQRYTVLQQAIENTRQKLEQLRAAEQAVSEAAANGTISEQQYRSFQRELASTENRLRRYQNELERTGAQLNGVEQETEQLESATESAGREAVSFGSLLKANIAGNLIADGLRSATNAAVAFTKQGIELATNLAEVQNVVDVTFGDGAQQIYDFSRTAAESFGLSALAAQKYTGTIGAMIKSAGVASDQAQEMSIAIAGLAGDMASFYNLDTDTAFEKLRAGISGETEPLKQLGINMSVANLEAYALSQGIEKSWKSMSQAEQTTLRYNYLMSVTADAQGDFARTSDNLANQQRILQLNMQNVSAELGQALLPALNQMLQKLNDMLSNGAETKQVISEVVNVLTVLGNIVVKTTDFLYDNKEALGYVAGGLAAITAALKIQSIIRAAIASYTTLAASLGATTVAQTALNTAMKANPIGLVIAAVTALIAVYDLLTTSYKELQEKAEKSMQEYEDAKQQLAETTAKLEENQTALKKLQEQWDNGFRTQDLADQLNMLTETNAGLQAQIEIQQKAVEIKKAQAEADQVALINSEKNKKGIVSATLALQEYNDGLQYIKDTEKERGEYLAQAEAARASGRAEEAEELENLAYYYEDSLKQAKEYQNELKDKLVLSAAALSEEAEKIEGVTEEGKAAKDQIEQFAQQVYNLVNAWEGVPEKVTTRYVLTREENIWGNYDFGHDYGTKAVTAELETLEDALAAVDKAYKTHKITENDYWGQRQEVLNKYRDEDSEEWWKYQDEVTAYYDSIAKKADEAAKRQAEAQQKATEKLKEAQEKANKERLETIEKQNKEELEAWEKGAEKTADMLSEAYDKLADQKAAAKEELLKIDLADTIEDDKGSKKTMLRNLEKEKQKMLVYQKSIEQLKKTGISDSLLAEIGKMDYQSGERQDYINSLLGLKPDKLQKYYADWEAVQATAEKVSQSMVQEELDSLNQKTVSAVNDIFGSMPKSAYKQGQETAQSYLQGIVDSMTGVNSSADISNILGKTAAATATATASKQSSVVSIDTPINFFVDGKKAIETTLKDILKGNKLTGGNNFTL